MTAPTAQSTTVDVGMPAVVNNFTVATLFKKKEERRKKKVDRRNWRISHRENEAEKERV